MDILNYLGSTKEVINIINNISVNFGIFSEDDNIQLEVNILNTDDSTTKKLMNLSDIMFFTEYGTLTIPPRHILAEIKRLIQPLYKDLCKKIILDKNSNYSSIVSQMRTFENQVNFIYIPMAVQNILQSNSEISQILKVEQDQKYLIDLNILKKYIKCKFFFKS